ncbi:hypothetical protein ACE1B6_24330 [Aerosakkonemataceae cyanobacterium BLCC-F154]|uniref:Uncharacterized protein n=1 Tax=Floridaenema fluviatile BLCC-F154 TaxID=3153640 RepID=A0ABV4YHS3_9CYAN
MTSNINWWWKGCPREVVQARKNPEKLAFFAKKYQKLAERFIHKAEVFNSIVSTIETFLNSYRNIQKEIEPATAKPQKSPSGRPFYSRGSIRSSFKDAKDAVKQLKGMAYRNKSGELMFYKDLAKPAKTAKEMLQDAKNRVHGRVKYWQQYIEKFNEWASSYGLPDIKRSFLKWADPIRELTPWYEMRQAKIGGAIRNNEDNDFYKRNSLMSTVPCSILPHFPGKW